MGTGKAKDGKNAVESGKYVRYTLDQVEVLEQIYNECPKPSSTRRQQLIKELPILSNIGQKQLKVWFQNRRCREKQRKETSRLQTWNTKLNAMNQILLEENERLQKQAAQLSTENQYLRQQLQMQHANTDLNQRSNQQVPRATTDTSSESIVTSGQQHQQSPPHRVQETSTSQLSTIAEKTLGDFLAKATGSIVNWIQMPGMKPGPDSIGAVSVSHSWGGVAARACSLVGLEPFKVAEVVKNRCQWLEDCRRLEILATFTAEHGGLVELVHTEMYAPTTLALSRDFCTIRCTFCMEDGSLVVCERSLPAMHGDHICPPMPGFVRTAMLPSGYLIRPRDGGGSIVLAVDNLSFECENNQGNLHLLYESSAILVQRMAHRVLYHLQCTAGELKEGIFARNTSTASQGLGRRIVRFFNNAINGFLDDGWVSISSDHPGKVKVCMNPCLPVRKTGRSALSNDCTPMGGGVICAKASILLEGVSPALFLRYMREHWTDWSEIGTGIYQGGALGTNTSNTVHGSKYSSVQVLQPAIGVDEVLEVVRLENHRSLKGDNAGQHETFMLQLCSGLDEASVGVYSQIIFAPISASIPDDAPLIPSGFRIFYLNDTTKAVLTMAFQFQYEAGMHDNVALKAQQYVQGLLGFVQSATNLMSPRLMLGMDLFLGMEDFVLVRHIADSYRVHFGGELLPTSGGSPLLLKGFNSVKDAIVCCAWKPFPELVIANCAAMDMLETSPSALREISFERMLNDSQTDYSEPPPFMKKQGHAHLLAGTCITSTGRTVSFESATGWKVLIGDKKMQVAAFKFSNWSFISAYY